MGQTSQPQAGRPATQLGGPPRRSAAPLEFVSGARADWAVTRAARVARPVVELPFETRFVGDLHLDLSDETALAAFEAFWERRPAGETWVWLGDLFEYWIGAGHEQSPAGRRVLAALSGAARRGLNLHLVVGNRDFLCGQRFGRLAGLTVYAQGFVAQFPSGPACLVLHGDELCSQDLGYQRLRLGLRAPWVQSLSEVLPAWLSGALARRLRRASRRALADKPAPIAEQAPAAADFLLAASGAGELVCGHAHRFRRTQLGRGVWWVVDACGGPRDCLRRSAAGFVAESSGYPGR